MATANELLEAARADLGYTENPAGSNKTKYGAWYGLDGQPWCMMAVQYWAHEAGVQLPVRTASCTAFLRAAQAVGNLYYDNFRPGDILLYTFDGGSDADHVGICERFDGSTVTAIEGNTSLSSDDNGGAVMRRQRNKRLVLAAWRPAFQEEEKEEEPVAEKDNKPSAWAKEAVDWAIEEKLIIGDENGDLKLHRNVTLEEVLVLLYRFTAI